MIHDRPLIPGENLKDEKNGLSWDVDNTTTPKQETSRDMNDPRRLFIDFNSGLRESSNIVFLYVGLLIHFVWNLRISAVKGLTSGKAPKELLASPWGGRCIIRIYRVVQIENEFGPPTKCPPSNNAQPRPVWKVQMLQTTMLRLKNAIFPGTKLMLYLVAVAEGRGVPVDICLKTKLWKNIICCQSLCNTLLSSSLMLSAKMVVPLSL